MTQTTIRHNRYINGRYVESCPACGNRFGIDADASGCDVCCNDFDPIAIVTRVDGAGYTYHVVDVRTGVQHGDYHTMVSYAIDHANRLRKTLTTTMHLSAMIAPRVCERLTGDLATKIERACAVYLGDWQVRITLTLDEANIVRAHVSDMKLEAADAIKVVVRASNDSGTRYDVRNCVTGETLDSNIRDPRLARAVAARCRRELASA